jgi:signal peptidase II
MLDQLIKLYIASNLMDKEFYFINHLVGFKPFQNTKYSWINSLGDFGVSLMIHIIISILLILAIFIAYDFISRKYTFYKLTFTMFAFLFAGAFCSLIDKVIWKGSLDYILLEGFFIFDLKDVYLTVFEVLLVLAAVLNYKGFRDMKGKMMLQDFRAYMKERFHRKK